MTYLNIEIKAVCKNPDQIREYLAKENAFFAGTDHQTDTYFTVGKGRLKLREGNIENNLIYYEREEHQGIKNSHFQLMKVVDPVSLKKILESSNGIKVVVEKKREIYYIRNVKFHIDDVLGLGSFVEIEAGNLVEEIAEEELKKQCEQYIQAFGIRDEDFIGASYSDMMLEKN